MLAQLKAALPNIARAALQGLAGVLRELPKNDTLWCYTIVGKDGSTPYMTRVLLPRFGERRLMLHWIHRPDADRDMHNHPWEQAETLILLGGYDEIRTEVEGRLDHLTRVTNPLVAHRRRPGDVAVISRTTFHRITDVLPGTWTLFLAGARHGVGWGFLTDAGYVPFEHYFEQRGLEYEGVRS